MNPEVTETVNVMVVMLTVPLVVANAFLSWRFYRIAHIRKNLLSWVLFGGCLTMIITSGLHAIDAIGIVLTINGGLLVIDDFAPLVGIALRYVLTIALYAIILARPENVSIRREDQVPRRLRKFSNLFKKRTP